MTFEPVLCNLPLVTIAIGAEQKPMSSWVVGIGHRKTLLNSGIQSCGKPIRILEMLFFSESLSWSGFIRVGQHFPL